MEQPKDHGSQPDGLRDAIRSIRAAMIPSRRLAMLQLLNRQNLDSDAEF